MVERSLISNGCEIYGEVRNSVIGAGVTIEEGAVVRDSILMQGVTIGKGCVVDKAIIAEDTKVGDHVTIGIGGEIPNKEKPDIYSHRSGYDRRKFRDSIGMYRSARILPSVA